MDQRRLVEQARQGDHDAFAELARAAVVRLDQAARLILRDPELARDAVQEGLIRAWRDQPRPGKEEPRVGRDPGFKEKALVAGTGFEPVTFGL